MAFMDKVQTLLQKATTRRENTAEQPRQLLSNRADGGFSGYQPKIVRRKPEPELPDEHPAAGFAAMTPGGVDQTAMHRFYPVGGQTGSMPQQPIQQAQPGPGATGYVRPMQAQPGPAPAMPHARGQASVNQPPMPPQNTGYQPRHQMPVPPQAPAQQTGWQPAFAQNRPVQQTPPQPVRPNMPPQVPVQQTFPPQGAPVQQTFPPQAVPVQQNYPPQTTAPQAAPGPQGDPRLVYFPGAYKGDDGNAYHTVLRVAQITGVPSCYRLIEFMQNGEAMIVNAEQISDAMEADRCMDLLFGAAYAMNQNFVRISGKMIYLIAPRQMQVIPFDHMLHMSQEDIERRWPGSSRGVAQEPAFRSFAPQPRQDDFAPAFGQRAAAGAAAGAYTDYGGFGVRR